MCPQLSVVFFSLLLFHEYVPRKIYNKIKINTLNELIEINQSKPIECETFLSVNALDVYLICASWFVWFAEFSHWFHFFFHLVFGLDFRMWLHATATVENYVRATRFLCIEKRISRKYMSICVICFSLFVSFVIKLEIKANTPRHAIVQNNRSKQKFLSRCMCLRALVYTSLTQEPQRAFWIAFMLNKQLVHEIVIISCWSGFLFFFALIT